MREENNKRDNEVRRKYIIKLEDGFHVRTGVTIQNFLKNYRSNVYIRKGDIEVKVDSPLSILTLGIAKGDEIEVKFEGEDALKMAQDFDKLVENNFYE
ncbi:MAG: HPr family phosphocarrier protein [Elusimicrobia bacterium]|nr:HPr family phosphocarrier protein [Elusimicrobiota bacterium]